MPGPAGQELKDRRRRSAAFLLGSGKEAAGAPNGAAGAAAERSGNQPHASAANQLQVPVVQAESVPNRSNESMITDGNRHIDRRYMLIREKVKLGQIATVWMSGDWNISDVGTKAIDVPTTERLTPLLCGFGELPIPAETKILFGPVERPERRESKNKAIPLKILNA